MVNQGLYNEQDVIIRLNNGDASAFDEIYWKYYQPVFRNAIRLLKDKESAEDVVQEVFLLLWQKRETINPEKSVGGWLMVISYNSATKALKKRLQKAIGLHPVHSNIPQQEEDVDFHELQLEMLEKAISTLSPQKRKVFELCKLRGKTYEETAKELNISHHTVKEYLSEAVANIKAFVQQHPNYGKMSAMALVAFVMDLTPTLS